MTIRLWDVVSRQPIGKPLTGSNEKVYAVAFYKDGKILASGGSGGALVLWNITSQSLAGEPFPIGWTSTVASSHDGKMLAVGDFEGNIGVVRSYAYERFQAHQKEVTSVAFSPDDTTLASASTDGTIQLHSWDGKTWKSTARSVGKKMKPVRSVAFRP